MIPLGPAAVAGAGTFTTAVFLAVAAQNRDVEREAFADVSARQFAGTTVLTFGALGGVVGLTALGATLTVGLPPAAVGMETASPELAGVGVVAGVGLAAGHYAVIAGLRRLGFGFTELYGELHPDDLHELSWLAGATAVQATVEEIVFRAAVIGAGAAAVGVGQWTLVPVAAGLFGIAHLGRGGGSVVSTTLAGVGFGAVFVQYGLVAAAVAHVTNNVVGFGRHAVGASDDADQPSRPTE